MTVSVVVFVAMIVTLTTSLVLIAVLGMKLSDARTNLILCRDDYKNKIFHLRNELVEAGRKEREAQQKLHDYKVAMRKSLQADPAVVEAASELSQWIHQTS